MQVQHVIRAIRTGRSANSSWPLVSGDPKSYGTDPRQNPWKFLPQRSEGQKNPGISWGQESFAAKTYENPNLVFSQLSNARCLALLSRGPVRMRCPWWNLTHLGTVHATTTQRQHCWFHDRTWLDFQCRQVEVLNFLRGSQVEPLQ